MIRKLKCSFCFKRIFVNDGGLKTKFFCSRQCFRKFRAKELGITHEEYCDRQEVGPKYERRG